MILHRAIAYRLQRANTPPAENQPEVMVFWESADKASAAFMLPALLAMAWGCRPADVEFYNHESEPELMAQFGFGTDGLGDAGLLVSGWYHGPLFCRADATLMLVRPLTLQRLLRARTLAVPWHAKQRAAAGEASGLGRSEADAQARRIRERAEAIGVTGFGGLVS